MNWKTRRPTRTHRGRLLTAACIGLLGMAALTACGGGGDDSAGTSTADFRSDSDVAQPGAAQPAPGEKAGAVPPEAARAAAGQKLVRRANLQLKVGSLTDSASRIRAIAAQQNGAVLTEELYSGQTGRDTSGSISITVPATSLDATIALIEKVGDVQFRTTSTQDVTGTYVDTQARVTSMTASVARIRELITRASTVTDLVALENELSQRQAELDGLTAQLTALKDSVTMSPISISLSTDDFEPVTAGGFLSGLRAGWSAFITSMSILVTALGAVLPFAVTLGVVLSPLVWWWRRRRATRSPFVATLVDPTATAPAPPPSAS